MDAEEKLIALKKAYADIILNISKEAAARVTSSERRAVRYQHELKVAKEEGLRMALRLKQMMDSRTSEAQAAALDKQKKIEELEAQLEEAEDIVKDLREELGAKQAEIERMKQGTLQNVNEPKDASSKEMATRFYSHQLDKFLQPNLSQQDECSKCFSSKRDCTCGSYVRSRDLPSIILRKKEPGLYRNGCTQRIRACERNSLDKELSLSGETDILKDKNNTEEQEEEEEDASKTQREGESKLLADTKLSSFPPFHWKRKRASRRRKTVTHLNRERNDLFHKPDQLPEPSREHIPVEEISHSNENPSKIEPMLSTGKGETCAESWDGRLLQEDEGLKEKIVPLEEEAGLTESLGSTVCKADVGNLDMPSNSVESNSADTAKELCRQSLRERVIKYTFQRKRKRGALSGSEVNVPTETEKETEDKKSGHKNVEPSKCSLLVESSRDRRRLAQVARQLISLSEKKWWQ